MSSRRSRQSSGSSRTSNDIVDVTKLRELLPENHRGRSNELSVSEVLDEICNYIRELKGQVKEQSERISDKLATIDSDTPQASTARSSIIPDQS